MGAATLRWALIIHYLMFRHSKHEFLHYVSMASQQLLLLLLLLLPLGGPLSSGRTILGDDHQHEVVVAVASEGGDFTVAVAAQDSH